MVFSFFASFFFFLVGKAGGIAPVKGEEGTGTEGHPEGNKGAKRLRTSVDRKLHMKQSSHSLNV